MADIAGFLPAFLCTKFNQNFKKIIKFQKISAKLNYKSIIK